MCGSPCTAGDGLDCGQYKRPLALPASARLAWRRLPGRSRGAGMTEQKALLRAMIAEPDDDAPRLVYADWLEGHGDPDRAAFIRVQCELARLPEQPWSLRDLTPEQERVERTRRKLQRRVNGLLRRHFKEWRKDIPDEFYADPKMFRRGFIETVHIDPNELMRAPDQLWPLAPMQTIHLVIAPPQDIERLCKAPRLARVTRLIIGGEGHTPEDSLRVVRAVAASR